MADDGSAAERFRIDPRLLTAQKLPPGAPRLAHPRSPAGVRLFNTAVRLAASPIAARVAEHRDAGADHVCIQVMTGEGALQEAPFPVEQWRRLAPLLNT